MVLKLIAGLLVISWLVLVLLGKGGFIHILLLNGLGVAAVEILTIVRTRMFIRDSDELLPRSGHQNN